MDASVLVMSSLIFAIILKHFQQRSHQRNHVSGSTDKHLHEKCVVKVDKDCLSTEKGRETERKNLRGIAPIKVSTKQCSTFLVEFSTICFTS